LSDQSWTQRGLLDFLHEGAEIQVRFANGNLIRGVLLRAENHFVVLRAAGVGIVVVNLSEVQTVECEDLDNGRLTGPRDSVDEASDVPEPAPPGLEEFATALLNPERTLEWSAGPSSTGSSSASVDSTAGSPVLDGMNAMAEECTAGTWDRTRLLAQRARERDQARSTRVAIDLLRSIPASEATAGDCANLVVLFIEGGNKASAANAARHYLERVGSKIDFETDEVLGAIARFAVFEGDPTLIIRAIPGDEGRLLQSADLLKIHAAVLWRMDRPKKKRADYQQESVQVWSAVMQGEQALYFEVRRLLDRQGSMPHRGWHTFEGSAGRDLLPGLHRGRMYSWKGDYGFITDAEGVRSFVHHSAIADPELRGRIDEAAKNAWRVRFELREPLDEAGSSQRRRPTCHAVVADRTADLAEQAGAEASNGAVADRRGTAGRDNEAAGMVQTGATHDPESSSPEDSELASIWKRINELQLDGHYKAAVEELTAWIGRRESSQQVVPPDLRERLSQLEIYVERIAQHGVRPGMTSLDRGLRALHIERDVKKAEDFLLKARAGQSCASKLAAARELVGLYLRRTATRLQDAIDLVCSPDIIACLETPRDIIYFFDVQARTLLRLGRAQQAEEAAREGLRRFGEARGKKDPDARKSLERDLAWALVNQGNPKDALKVLSQPGHADEPGSQRVVAAAELALGHLGQAEAILSGLVERRPDDAISLELLTQVRQRNARGSGAGDPVKTAVPVSGGLVDDVDPAETDRFAESVRRLFGALERNLTGDGFRRFAALERLEEEELTAAELLRRAIAFVRAVAESDLHVDSRISFALEGLIALDRVASLQLEDVDGAASGSMPEALLRPILEFIREGGSAETLDAAAGQDDISRLVALHLVARSRHGRGLADGPDGGSIPIFATEDRQTFLRSAIEYRVATENLRQDFEAQADRWLEPQEYGRIEALLRAASACACTATDRRTVSEARVLLRKIRAASHWDETGWRIDPAFADDILSSVVALRGAGQGVPTVMWVEAFDPLLTHIRDTCRAAKDHAPDLNDLDVEVEVNAPLLFAERDRERVLVATVPVIVRNPIGRGRISAVSIEGVLAIEGEVKEANVAVPADTRLEATLQPGTEAHLYLQFRLDVGSLGSSTPRRAILRELKVSYAVERTSRPEEQDIESEFKFNCEVLNSSEYERHDEASLDVVTDLAGPQRSRSSIFGRDEEIQILRRHFAESDDPALQQLGAVAIIYGLQQTGKSTLAQLIVNELRVTDIPAVMWEVTRGAYGNGAAVGDAAEMQKDAARFFREVVVWYRRCLSLPRTDVELKDPTALVDTLRASWDEYVQSISPERARTPLIAIDEYTEILAGLDNGLLPDIVLSVWRTIAAAGLANVLLVGHGNFREVESGIRRGSYPYLSTARMIRLEFLSFSATEDLCTKPFKANSGSHIVFTESAIEEVHALSAGHARTAVECISAAVGVARRARRAAVTRADVRRGIEGIVDLERTFNNLTDPQLREDLRVGDTHSRRLRRFVAEIVAANRSRTGLTLEDIVDAVRRKDPASTVDQVRTSLEQLVDWNALVRTIDVDEYVYRPKAQILREILSSAGVVGDANDPLVLESKPIGPNRP
jgi:tetratricopeptide (TPR) repeat protein